MTTTRGVYADDGSFRVTAVGGVGAGIAPSSASYIVQTPDGTLSAEQALSTLATGILKNTTTTGVLSIIVPAAGIETFLATPSSANLKTAVTDETGSGALVFGTSPTLTTPNIVGTVTNDSAAAGSVGEYISGELLAGSSTGLTTATAKTVISISLTAGDWDVQGSLGYVFNTTTSYTKLEGSVSQTNNTHLDTNADTYFLFSTPAAIPGAASIVFPTPRCRISLSGTTTIYLVASATFTVSTLSAYGKLWARRVR